MNDLVVYKAASLSKCGQYRFTLHRDWDVEKGRVVWIMLNPSTADATLDDPTIRRCMNFTHSWGHGALTVVNLFPFRATQPADLKTHEEPKEIKQMNMSYIEQAAFTEKPAEVICAWGAHGGFRKRDKDVLKILNAVGANLSMLRLTADGSPSHPLYLPGTLTPTWWDGVVI